MRGFVKDRSRPFAGFDTMNRQPARERPAAPTGLCIGPSGWAYDDWYGPFYPKIRPAGFRPLAFLARYFNAVEVNSSFYRTPSAHTTAAWQRLVPGDFRFAVKLHRSFTHDRATFPERAEIEAFRAALAPLRDAGVLGPVLAQFPWSLRFAPASVAWLERVAAALEGHVLHFEVRHASWAEEEGLAALRRLGGYCNIDQPALRDCLPPSEHVFGDVAYVRLHGRNAANWFAEGRPAFARYDYLYSDAELREWVERLNRIGGAARETYVFTNNHYRGQGPANAVELRALLEGKPQPAPAELVRAFPRLARLATAPAPETLFEL